MFLKHLDLRSDVNLKHSLLEGFFQHGGRKSFLFLLIDFDEILKNTQNTICRRKVVKL